MKPSAGTIKEKQKKPEERITATGKRAVLTALLINLLSGAQYTWSMLGASLMRERGWTIVQVTLPYSILFVTASVWSIAVGYIGDRTGPNRFIRLGALTTGAGLFLAGNCENWWTVLFAVGVLMGIGSSSLANSTSPTALRYVPMKYKGLISGLVSAGIGWTSFYMAPILQRLLAVTTVQRTFSVLGASLGSMLFLLSFLLPNPVKGGIEPEPRTNELTFGQAAHDRRTWILFLIFSCSSMAGLVFTSQVTTIAKLQTGVEDTAVLVMAMGVVNGIGRLLTPTLSDRIGVLRTWMLLFAVTAADMIILNNTGTIRSMLPALCVMSFFAGGSNPLMWATVAEIFGKEHMGTVFGIVTNGFAVASVAGPMLSALAVQKSGTYTPAYYFVAAAAIAGMVLVRALHREMRRPACETEPDSIRIDSSGSIR